MPRPAKKKSELARERAARAEADDPKKKKGRKLDLFKAIRAIDSGDYEYRNNLPEDERKELDGSLGLPMLVWMSGAEDDNQHEFVLDAINEIANPGYFELGKHKDLQFKLLAACGARTWVKHVWCGTLKTSRPGKTYDVIRKAYPHIDDSDVDLWLDLNGSSGLQDLCDDLGMQKEERKKVMDDFKKRFIHDEAA